MGDGDFPLLGRKESSFLAVESLLDCSSWEAARRMEQASSMGHSSRAKDTDLGDAILIDCERVGGCELKSQDG